ncbi:MAG TPA: hypothetical protein VK939_02185 [Longimicrobiales bacterium]|nr:hypothetical protein [Longimicrobiales bacterium]
MKTWGVVLGMVAMLGAGASNAEAQRIGVQGNWSDDFDLGIGARVELNLPNLLTSEGPLANTFLIGSFDYFFPDCPADLDCSYWEINGNLAVPFAVSGLSPYAGAGLNIARIDVGLEDSDFSGSDTEIGLNLLGGLRFPIGGVSAYGEARLELGGGEQFVLTFGAMVGGSR